ncbi:MAG: DUF4339 domain-containing protein [Bacteroidaceae bacterium]|nr:DUF4339 domain-containing protein [Bacteroidaceae bacterium]
MDYYILVNGQQTGPFSVDQLGVTGVEPDTMVWTEGMTDWQPAVQVAELAAVVNWNQAQPPSQQPAYASGTTQQQASRWPEQPPKKKKRTGLWVTLAILAVLLIVGGVFAATNPSKEKHMEELKAIMTDAMKSSNMDDDTKMGMQLAMSMMSKVFDQAFDYHNYFVFSTVTERKSGEKVSTGFLGSVKITNEDKIRSAMDGFNKLTNSDDTDTDDDFGNDSTSPGEEDFSNDYTDEQPVDEQPADFNF